MKFFDDDDTAPDHFTRDESPAPGTVHDPDDPFAPASADAAEPAPLRRQRRHRFRRVIAWTIAVIVAVGGVAGYVRYFLPYADDALASGYVRNVERRGILFKTFEGELLSEEAIADTTRLYQRDFFFSIPNDSMARVLQNCQGSGRKVTLRYERYYATIPWRGASKNVVTDIIFP